MSKVFPEIDCINEMGSALHDEVSMGPSEISLFSFYLYCV